MMVSGIGARELTELFAASLFSAADDVDSLLRKPLASPEGSCFTVAAAAGDFADVELRSAAATPFTLERRS